MHPATLRFKSAPRRDISYILLASPNQTELNINGEFDRPILLFIPYYYYYYCYYYREESAKSNYVNNLHVRFESTKKNFRSMIKTETIACQECVEDLFSREK